MIILPIPRGNYALNTASINIKGCLPLIEHTVLLSTIAQHNTTILSPMLLSLEEINSRLIRRVSFFKSDSSQILPHFTRKMRKNAIFLLKDRKICLFFKKSVLDCINQVANKFFYTRFIPSGVLSRWSYIIPFSLRWLQI